MMWTTVQLSNESINGPVMLGMVLAKTLHPNIERIYSESLNGVFRRRYRNNSRGFSLLNY